MPWMPYFMGACGIFVDIDLGDGDLAFRVPGDVLEEGRDHLAGSGHHSAQKSTSTGPGACRTDSSKDWPGHFGGGHGGLLTVSMPISRNAPP